MADLDKARTTPLEHAAWRRGVLAVLTATGVVLCLTIAAAFVPALTWSVALAVSLQKPYGSLERRLKRPALAAAVATVLVLLVVVIPVVLLVWNLSGEVAGLAKQVQSGAAQSWAQGMLAKYPRLQHGLDGATQAMDVQGSSKAAAGWLAGKLQGLLSGGVRTVTQMAVTLYALFFLFKDGGEARAAARSVLPMAPEQADHLLHRMAESMQATILGSLSIAAIQGTLGGLAFFALGVPQAAVWAVVMAMMATIPSLGTFVVWAPVAMYLALSGSLVKAALLTGWGMAVIGSVDNFLYPTLVSRRLQVHPLAAFFAVLGGVALFGISGLVLGPLTLVTTMELIRLWDRKAFRVGDSAAGQTGRAG